MERHFVHFSFILTFAGSMYQYCRKSGITLFTVSHRKSLWKYHEYYLQFDGRGDYEFGTIDDSKEEFGS